MITKAAGIFTVIYVCGLVKGTVAAKLHPVGQLLGGEAEICFWQKKNCWQKLM